MTVERVTLPVPDGRNGRCSDHLGDRLALAAAAGLCVALALFGARYHWVEEAGTAERDGYVAQAEQLLHGDLPHDPYRPLLYPLTVAAASLMTGGTFAAARLVSNLSAAMLAWLAYACCRRLGGGAAAGGWAMALVAVNPNVWILGQHVTTDMLFAALAAGCYLAGLRYLREPAPGAALLAGSLLGLAAFTRSNAVFLLPALLAAWWLGGRLPAARPAASGSWRNLAIACGAAVMVLLPHWYLRYAAFGNPFYDENWKNLALKLYGYPDWSYLDRVPFASAGAIIAHDPKAVVTGAVAELWRFAIAGAAQLYGTWVHVLLVVAGGLIAALGLPGGATRSPAGGSHLTPADRIGTAPAGRALRLPRLPAWFAVWFAGPPGAARWLILALASFVCATALTFFTWGRFLLLLLPGSYALAATATRRFGHRARLALDLVAAAAVLVLGLKTFAFRLPAFVADHPYTEVKVLRRLDAVAPPGAVFGGTSPFLGRYLHHRYVSLPDAFGTQIAAPSQYYALLHQLVIQDHVSDLVVGPLDLRSRPASLLAALPAVPWLQAAGADHGVRTWRVVTSSAPLPPGPPPAGRSAASAMSNALAPTVSPAVARTVSPAAARDRPLLGILEDDPSDIAGQANVRLVRVAFQKNGAAWRAFAGDCPDAACLKTISGSYPAQTVWTIALAGRPLGQVTGRTPPAYRYYSWVGTQQIVGTDKIPTVGKRSAQNAGFLGAAVYRPLIAVAPPRFADPDGWRQAPLPASIVTALRRHFHDRFSQVDNCNDRDHGQAVAWPYLDRDVRVVATRSSKRKWLLARLYLDGYRCDGFLYGSPFMPQTFVVSPDHKITWLGEGMRFVDAGDYDGDGRSEVIFALEGYNLGGYAMYYDDFQKASLVKFNYH